MNKLNIHFENCFGIKKLSQEFIFNESNKVNAIYAKNGLMKTSFTKVFKKIQDGKDADIKDEIFNLQPVVKEIKVDKKDVNPQEIFVIRSFEREYESASISSLLVNEVIKTKLSEVLELRNKLFKSLEQKSGLKIVKTSLGKKVYELENQLFIDFNLKDKSFLENLHLFKSENSYSSLLEIEYNDLFDKSVIDKISKKEFQSKIADYLNKSDEVYSKYSFLKKGEFTLPKLKNIRKGLKDNNFFVSSNKLVLGGNLDYSDLNSITTKVEEIETDLKNSKEFKAIEDAFADSKGTRLKDIIESDPSIIEELKIENLGELKKKVWNAYFFNISEQLDVLIEKYNQLKSEMSNINIDETTWKKAIDIFNDRFTLPFKMDIENLDSCVIGESLPKVVFKFCAKENEADCIESDWVSLNRNELESKNTLSQGENRALYLLNIIFDIEKRKKEKQKTLFIVDDIADSFDYKNKYAIIEYLNDIINVEEKNFYMIVLSHNFDFYRTISSRLDIDREYRFHALKKGDEIKLEQEHYQKNPFDVWKINLRQNKNYSIEACKRHFIGLIPFVINIIEHGKDINISIDYESDYKCLTNLLHLKEQTESITVGQLKQIYKSYIQITEVDTQINDSLSVYQLILETANSISAEDFKLENKLILAIASRLEVEKYMIYKIKNSTHIFEWKKSKTGNSIDFLKFISNDTNQTRGLFNGFKQICTNEQIKLLESVNIMTPENIHLNSFMYEPILDMDITELLSLYNKIRSLVNN